jgi:hypothetical protein
MVCYSKAAMERTMKIQEVLLRAMARKITWFEAAEILGFSDRHLRRIRERYEECLVMTGCSTGVVASLHRNEFPCPRWRRF